MHLPTCSNDSMRPPIDALTLTAAGPVRRTANAPEKRLQFLNLSAHLANLDERTKNIDFKYSIKRCRFAHALATPTIELGTRQRIGAGGRLPGELP